MLGGSGCRPCPCDQARAARAIPECKVPHSKCSHQGPKEGRPPPLPLHKPCLQLLIQASYVPVRHHVRGDRQTVPVLHVEDQILVLVASAPPPLTADVPPPGLLVDIIDQFEVRHGSEVCGEGRGDGGSEKTVVPSSSGGAYGPNRSRRRDVGASSERGRMKNIKNDSFRERNRYGLTSESIQIFFY